MWQDISQAFNRTSKASMLMLLPFRKISAYTILLVTFAIVVPSSGLMCHLDGITPGDVLAETIAIVETMEATAGNALINVKSQKTPFSNYETFFGDNILIPGYDPLVTGLFFHQTLKTLSKVYSDIFIPPQNLV